MTPAQAETLGLYHEEDPDAAYAVDAEGMVEISRWRHAVINFPHPLLRQGLVILDTPGLNAIGTEPELTLRLIPDAHVVVFVLAADAGVTKSDLELWRGHVAPAIGAAAWPSSTRSTACGIRSGRKPRLRRRFRARSPRPRRCSASSRGACIRCRRKRAWWPRSRMTRRCWRAAACRVSSMCCPTSSSRAARDRGRPGPSLGARHGAWRAATAAEPPPRHRRAVVRAARAARQEPCDGQAHADARAERKGRVRTEHQQVPGAAPGVRPPQCRHHQEPATARRAQHHAYRARADEGALLLARPARGHGRAVRAANHADHRRDGKISQLQQLIDSMYRRFTPSMASRCRRRCSS